MSDLVIRRAAPADAHFLAWSILTATRSHLSKGWFDIALCRPEEECLEFLRRLTLISELSPWHYSRFTIAGTTSRPVAALCAVRPAAYKHSAIAILGCLKRMDISLKERESFSERSAYLFTCKMQPDDDALVIEVAATLPEGRGRGLITELLSQAFKDCQNQGLNKVETSCFIGNRSAERAYERAGFYFVQEKRHAQFEATAGAPGIRRFLKNLQ